ncbi:EF-hand calcium-binding domain-containing protein 1-like [Stegodyphus dumicola]|uniref:EF-hand calcium-binding domain-containing protein 1-like n=1 Tax=Stegodyphus dumicola TaxID=202533 RepID=UPI0015AED0E6|nr:EF-hand calcium-binding domain-containing protein 1-like [Stegodyphus dumicola]
MNDNGIRPSSKKVGITKRKEIALIQKLLPKTHFNEKQLKYLFKFYSCLVGEKKSLEKIDFLEMLHETFGYVQHFFMNRVFLFADTNKDGRIDIEEFVHFLSIVLCGTREEKIRFCFDCYDLNENMQLSRDVITTLLNHTSSEAVEINPDMILELLERILKKMDKDGDGILVYEEYKSAALEDWVLIEAFGQCLPDYNLHYSFIERMEKPFAGKRKTK